MPGHPKNAPQKREITRRFQSCRSDVITPMRTRPFRSPPKTSTRWTIQRACPGRKGFPYMTTMESTSITPLKPSCPHTGRLRLMLLLDLFGLKFLKLGKPGVAGLVKIIRANYARLLPILSRVAAPRTPRIRRPQSSHDMGMDKAYLSAWPRIIPPFGMVFYDTSQNPRIPR